jgi:hypothetical protein
MIDVPSHQAMARHWVSSALILRDHVVWFSWTATPDAIAEQLVLKNGGFRSIGMNNYQTEVAGVN